MKTKLLSGAIIIFFFGISPVWGWDCQDPAIDCEKLIVEFQSSPQLAAMSVSALVQPEAHEVVTVPSTTDPEDYIEALEQMDNIVHVEPAYVTELAALPPADGFSAFPDDPLLEDQEYYNGISGELLAIDQAWNLLTASPVIVAVIDSGIDYGHEDLHNNIWVNYDEIPNNGLDDDGNGYVDDVHGYNFYEDTANPIDRHSHGTHLAGIIGAMGDNGIGIAGLLWDVQIMPLRFTSDSGAGNTAFAIEAIHYAVQQGAQVINMSWTVKANSSGGLSSSLRDVIRSYENQGVIFVAASGNGDQNAIGYSLDETPLYPAAINSNNVISVGAMDSNGDLAYYSNYGLHTVHILAPGDNVFSTFPADDYGYMTGTSMAAAFVSAAAAMILTEHPNFSAADVKNVLLNASNYNADLEGLVMSSGTLNLGQSVKGRDVSPYIVDPSISPTSSAVSPGAGCTLAALPQQTDGSLLAIIMLLASTWVVIGLGKFK